MKVKELIELLSRLDQEAIVLEESKSEHRRLHKEDVSSMLGPVFVEDDNDFVDGSFVSFDAWS